MKKAKQIKPKVVIETTKSIIASIGNQHIGMVFNNEGICTRFETNLPHQKNVKQFRLSILLTNSILDAYEKES